jgi:hypothetical protein
MSFGLQVKNNDNQIIIDSELSHYHFLGKYTAYSTTQVPDILNGPGTVSYGPNNNKDMTGMPSKGSIHKYTIPSNGAKPPMVFIKNISGGYMSVVLTSRSGSNWDTWVFSSSGSAAAPTIYAFSPRDQFSTSPSGFGLETLDASGNPTFDSNLKPLRVIGGGNITAPSVAHTGSFGGRFIAYLDVNVTPASTAFTSNANASDIIYYCPSIAHSCHQYEYAESDSGISNWQFYQWSRGDLWWAFYRSAFRIVTGSGDNKTFESQYGVYARGHVWQHVADSSSIFAALIIGALTGGVYFAVALAAIVATGAFTNAGVAEGGYLPYSNGSRNSSLPNTFILSRASYYD